MISCNMSNGETDMETDRLLACLQQLKSFQTSNNIDTKDYQEDDDKENAPYQANIKSNEKNADECDLSQYLVPTKQIADDEGEDVYDDEFEIYPLSEDEHLEQPEPLKFQNEPNLAPLKFQNEPNLDPLKFLNGAPIDEKYLENAEKILLDIEQYNVDEEVKMSVLTQLYNQIKLKSEEVNRRESLHSPHSNGLTEVREEVPLSPQQKARNNFFSPVAEMAENGVVTEEGFSPVQDPHDIEYDPGIDSDYEESTVPPHNLSTHNLSTHFDEQPAPVVTKTFDQLLEEQLELEAARPVSPVKAVKKPFLKRGEGIARFNGPPPKAKKPAKKTKKGPNSANSSSEPKAKRLVAIVKPAAPEAKPKNKLQSKVKLEHEPMIFAVPKNPEKTMKKTTVMSPQRSPERCLAPQRSQADPKLRTPGRSNKTMAKPQNAYLTDRLEKTAGLTQTSATTIISKGDGTQPSVRADLSAMITHDQLEEQLAQQESELDEFRMLEQAAANKSMNTLLGLINPGASRTPRVTSVDEEEPFTEPCVLSMNIDTMLNLINPRASGARRKPRMNSVVEEEPRAEPVLQHLTAKPVIQHLTAEPVIQHVTTEPDPLANILTATDKLEHCSSFEFDDDGFEDDETWGFEATPVKPSRPVSVREKAPQKQAPPVVPPVKVEPAPSVLLSKMFSGLRIAPPPPPPLPTPPDNEQDKLKTELKSKLAELEREVSRFQMETSKLSRVRNEKESVLRKLREETDLFEKQQESEQKRFQEYKDSEMKKIRAEKKQLEMSALSSQQRAAKLEQVDHLTHRVKELEEELSRKEGRWNTTHNRLKGRSEALEEECTQLRSQITQLEKQKLELWEKEVERSSHRRHKSAQTDTPLQPLTQSAIRTVGVPTPSLTTISCPDLPQAAGGKTKIPRKSPNPPTKSPNPPTKSVRTDVRTLVSSESSSDDLRLGTPTTRKQPTARVSEWDTPPLHPPVSRGPAKNVQFFDTVHSPNQSPRTHNPRTVPAQSGSSAVQSAVVSSSSSCSGMLSPGGTKGPVEDLPDGSQLVRYTNGTTKHIESHLTTVTYFNGDVKKTYKDGRVVYQFKEAGITHCRHNDGTEVIEFPSGQKEIKRSEGSTEIIFPDKSTRITYADGREESHYADGTVVTVDVTGQRLIKLPNGQREVHTAAFKRREYPDGTTKTVFADGRQETRYCNGRVRRKDAQGNVVEDVMLGPN